MASGPEKNLKEGDTGDKSIWYNHSVRIGPTGNGGLFRCPDLWRMDMESYWNIKGDIGMSKGTPYDLVHEQCEILADITDGNVIARIISYDGCYKSHHNLDDSIDAFLRLGEGSPFVYEFFVTSKKTPRYKYRICFLYYSALLYPAGISLEQTIAEELGMETEFYMEDEQRFIEVLKGILGSEILSKIIKNLIRINM